jgi:uncharacterized spore protein YtfJ
MMGMPTTTNPLEIVRSSVASTAEKVFVSPIERDGLTVIPAATVGAGGGGGGGPGNQGGESGSGEGGGFGLRARPAGAFVIRNGSVRWQPAIDVNRLVMGGQIVAIVALLVLRTIVRSRARRAKRSARWGR